MGRDSHTRPVLNLFVSVRDGTVLSAGDVIKQPTELRFRGVGVFLGPIVLGKVGKKHGNANTYVTMFSGVGPELRKGH